MRQLAAVLIAAIAVLVLNACASSGGSPQFSNRAGTANANVCKRGDTPVDSESQCLQDDAACYQLANGGWCTGERGVRCPAGSDELPAGARCPGGYRCFNVAESLQCGIRYQ